MSNYFIYIPTDYRQSNFRSSCVHASVTNCLRTVGLWKEAERFWQTYRGSTPFGENPNGIGKKLSRFNIQYKIIHDENDLIYSLESGRGAGVSWGGMHFVNLIGLISGNAYILDNENPQQYIVRSWDRFINSFRRSGRWGILILSGKPPNPIQRPNLKGYEH